MLLRRFKRSQCQRVQYLLVPTKLPPIGSRTNRSPAELRSLVPQMEAPPPLPPHIPADAADLIRACLTVEPTSRPQAHRLLDHPFLQHPLPDAADAARAAMVTAAAVAVATAGAAAIIQRPPSSTPAVFTVKTVATAAVAAARYLRQKVLDAGERGRFRDAEQEAAFCLQWWSANDEPARWVVFACVPAVRISDHGCEL